MQAEQLKDFAISGLEGDAEKGPVQWVAGHLDQLKAHLVSLGGGPPLHGALRELALFVLFLEQELQSGAAARELAVMLDQMAAPEAQQLIEESGENRRVRGQQFAEWTGPQGEAPSAEGAEKIDLPKVPKPIRG